jgi:hypothetical protein
MPICEECGCDLNINEKCNNCEFIHALFAYIGIDKDEFEKMEKEKEL